MSLTRKLQYTSLAILLFIIAYMISGWALIAYIWILAGFLLWLTGGSRFNVLKVSIFWPVAIWIDPVSEWMLDLDIDQSS